MYLSDMKKNSNQEVFRIGELKKLLIEDLTPDKIQTWEEVDKTNPKHFIDVR